MKPILFIAPYTNLAKTASLVAKRMNIDLIIEIARDQKAVQLVQKHPHIDVVISRGGTASELQSIPEIAVVEIKMSITDVLTGIYKLLSQGAQNIGIVTINTIFDEAMVELPAPKGKVYMRPCRTHAEIRQTVKELHLLGVDSIIGCKVASEAAQKLGMAVEFLDSSDISVEKALKAAITIEKAKEYDRLRLAQLHAIINNIDEGVIAVTNEGNLNFSNCQAERILGDNINNIKSEELNKIQQNHNTEKIISINNAKILINSTPLLLNDQYKGEVHTFREIKSIQDVERKVRVALYQKGLYAKKRFTDIIGQSDSIKNLISKAKKYATNDSNIIIYGETGTGKEVLAQSIHNESSRHHGPFVSVNCGSIPASLMESELFGYVSGAFTGALKGGKAGLFELAHGGTIFLDEIGELTLEIQTRLLRVLQEREVMRIGDDKLIPIDIKVICATNKDLLQLVKEGKFRQDLYYRIHVLVLRVPPLRERPGDIKLLFNYYLHQLLPSDTAKTLSPVAWELLCRYNWPGNIRELMNVVEVLALSDEDCLEPAHLQDLLTPEAGECGYLVIKESNSLKEMETAILKEMQKKYSNIDLCRKLHISRITLWRKTGNVSI